MPEDRSTRSFVGTNGPDGVIVGRDADTRVGFHGANPVAQQTIAAAGSDALTTQTLANDLRAKLIALGLVRAS